MSSIRLDDQVVRASAATVPQYTEARQPTEDSYGQILKSSALVGGSSVLNIAIGIFRTKAMAVLLGPGGMGLFGLYNSIADLGQSIAGMGVNSSGVRQIAEAAGSNDTERIARTAAVLRRTSIALGALGAVLLVVFSDPISTATFGSSQHAAAISLLSVAVFFRLISGGQGALVQGMRRISDLAKMGVLGALFGTLISIPVVYFLRERGIVPSLIAVAAVTIVTSWWYSRKIDIRTTSMAFSQMRQEAASLLKLGVAFMSSGLMAMASAYIVRIIILHKVGVEATGLYQSAWTLGGLYVGFILQAMGADFYPRLTAHANDNLTCNRMVNEQVRVGLLLAGPGVIATLTFAPAVITVLYSAKFGAAVGILRWISLGAALQVITWPMGFIIVAKNRSGLLVLSELAWAIVHVGLAWSCVTYFGVNGAGMAFFGSYVFHGLLIYHIVRRPSGFRWSNANKHTGILFLFLIAVVFCDFYVLPLLWAACLGTLAVLLSGTYSLRQLSRLVPLQELPRPMQRLVVAFGLAPAGPATLD
jgi:enterobacterial common antigen flippase